MRKRKRMRSVRVGVAVEHVCSRCVLALGMLGARLRLAIAVLRVWSAIPKCGLMRGGINDLASHHIRHLAGAVTEAFVVQTQSVDDRRIEIRQSHFPFIVFQELPVFEAKLRATRKQKWIVMIVVSSTVA